MEMNFTLRHSFILHSFTLRSFTLRSIRYALVFSSESTANDPQFLSAGTHGLDAGEKYVCPTIFEGLEYFDYRPVEMDYDPNVVDKQVRRNRLVGRGTIT